jgi:hypothetical protein
LRPLHQQFPSFLIRHIYSVRTQLAGTFSEISCLVSMFFSARAMIIALIVFHDPSPLISALIWDLIAAAKPALLACLFEIKPRVSTLSQRESQPTSKGNQRVVSIASPALSDGFTVWLKVVKAVETLQRKGPPEGEVVN